MFRDRLPHDRVSIAQLRSRVLDRHSWIRRELDQLAKVTGAGTGPVQDDEALSRTRSICRRVLRMIDEEVAFEGAELEPLLRELDAWGELRCHHLETLHEGLDQGARSVSWALKQPELAAARLLALVAHFIDHVQRYLDREDAMLDPTILQDEVIAIDRSDG